MNTEKIKELLNSCFTAKKITETMEELPKGFKPRHIHVIDSIYTIGERKEDVRISDVSKELHITTPSVTKLINELEAMEAVEKYTWSEDKRVTLVRLTKLGQCYQKHYVLEYHEAWAKGLSDITDEEVDLVVSVIKKLQQAMPKQGGEHE